MWHTEFTSDPMFSCSWSALRLLMLLCAFVSYTSLAGTTGLLFLFKGRPRAVDSKESDVENYPGLSVWVSLLSHKLVQI